MIAIGSNEIIRACIGDTEIDKMYLGEDLVFSSAPIVLPYDAQVEWIGTTGTPYIIAGFAGTQNHAVEMEFCPSSAKVIVFGSRTTSSKNNLSIVCSANSIYADFGDGTKTRCTLSVNVTDGHWYKVTMSKSGRRIEDLDSGAYAEQNTLYTSNFTTPQYLRIGGKANNFPNDHTAFKGKIGKVKIYLNGSLVRNFIPVRVGTKGYLYDRVTKQLFSNASSGSFTVGNDV